MPEGMLAVMAHFSRATLVCFSCPHQNLMKRLTQSNVNEQQGVLSSDYMLGVRFTWTVLLIPLLKLVNAGFKSKTLGSCAHILLTRADGSIRDCLIGEESSQSAFRLNSKLTVTSISTILPHLCSLVCKECGCACVYLSACKSALH